MKKIKTQTGFSLIEVVVALGITAFALVTLIGLFSVGLQTGKESVETIQAANLVSGFIAERRAAPSANITGAAIPTLDVQASGTSYYTRSGAPTTVERANYQFNYSILTDTTRVQRLRVSIHWPASTAFESKDVKGRYEVLTYISLP